MDAVLHPDFSEVGRSGRVFTRDEVLEMPHVEIRVNIPRESLTIVGIAPGVALVTYETTPLESLHGAALRASIWLADGTRWLLRYHHATPAT